MHQPWTSQPTPLQPATFPSNYFSLPPPRPASSSSSNSKPGPSSAPLPSPPSGSGSHSPSLDCSLCETPQQAAGVAGLAFCCEEPQCFPLLNNDLCGPTCPSTSFVGWDDMLLDDCEECITGQEVSSATATAGHLAGNAESSDACCAPSWPPAGTGAGGGVPFDSFTECCTEGCFDLPDLAVGPGAPKDDCPDCWQGPSSISGSREDDLTESGSSVATPAEREMLSTSPKGLGALLKGLDEAAIQEILNCCCCGPELQHNPSAWDPSQHASHQHVAQHVHFPSPANQLVFNPFATSPFLPSHLSPTTQQQQTFPHHNFALPLLPAPIPFPCKWADCTLTFENKDLLVSHVNTEHLAVPRSTATTKSADAFELAALGLKLDAGLAATASGVWDPSAQTSGTVSPRQQHESTSLSSTPVKNFGGDSDEDDKLAAATLALHQLLQEHLSKMDPAVARILTSSLANAAAAGTTTTSHAHAHPHGHGHPHSHGHHRPRVHVHHSHPYGVHPRSSTSTNSSTPAPPPLPSSSGTHACRWKGCQLSFETSAELMTHLSLEHVGSGKASYECEWEGCERASEAPGGGRGFAQRQKVMRHLQTHTGDRPFVCDVCNKSFSEAMTLTQHKRVHTNERPYKCTFDGCDKAFSLASALTIHLRTHTGAKPFHCPYPGCSSAFSESSNLSKHVRTHKGEKSYACDECGKAFSRSDQLARHRKIHAKARGE